MKPGASYLDREPGLKAEELSSWGFKSFALLSLSAIAVIYLVLAGAYLGLSCGKPRSGPASEAAPPSGLAVLENELTHYLLNNKNEGVLLVVTGRVRNNYPEARRHIKISGRLLDAGGRIVDERVVYGGNIIAREDLSRLPLVEILLRLADKNGRRGSNLHVPEGAQIPFMMIFENPPPNGPYQIEAAGSDSLPVR